jgi:tetratricopeptide (TPR) repeat protein
MVLRTLGQTGLVGALLLYGAIACAMAAALQAIRGRRGLTGAVAAGALGSFVYFLVHGSVDWFYEIPGLGGVAFAMLGLAAGLVPRPAVFPRVARARDPLASTPVALAVTTVGAGLALAAVVPPLLAARENLRGIDTFNEDPGRAGDAFEILDRSAGLNPYSTLPRYTQGGIAAALGQSRLAARYYADAIERDPEDVYAHLVLASLESSAGRRAEAERLLTRVRELSPRDELARRLLKRVRAGRRIRYGDVTGNFTARRENRGR